MTRIQDLSDDIVTKEQMVLFSHPVSQVLSSYSFETIDGPFRDVSFVSQSPKNVTDEIQESKMSNLYFHLLNQQVPVPR